jgi:hypothetical protein
MEVKLFSKIKKMLGSEDEELIRLGYEILCHHEEDKERVELIVLSYINKKYMPQFMGDGDIDLYNNLFPYDKKGYTTVNTNIYNSNSTSNSTSSLTMYTTSMIDPRPNYKVINLKNKNQQK